MANAAAEGYVAILMTDQLEGSFGYLVENQDPAVTAHVHFDNLVVVSGLALVSTEEQNHE